MRPYLKHFNDAITECNRLGIDPKRLQGFHENHIMNTESEKAITKYEKYLNMIIRSLLEIEEENISEKSFGFDPTRLLTCIVRLRNSLYRLHKEMIMKSSKCFINIKVEE